MRRRSLKNRTIGYVIKQKYNIEIDKMMLADIVGEVLNLDRSWRLLLRNNPELRGSDYHKDKKRLEQEAQVRLGYEENFHQNVKKLKTL